MILVEYADLIARLRTRPATVGQAHLICVDGPAGSGKTTFAARLGAGLNAPVVHMDDLYEGWEGTFSDALPHRIEAWILTPLRHGIAPAHPRYDWHQGRYAGWVEHPVTSALIIEGVGSAHRAIRAHATLTVWVESDSSLRLDRVLQRDGEEIREAMLEFQRRESEHFLADSTASDADLIVRGDPAMPHEEGQFLGEARRAQGWLTL